MESDDDLSTENDTIVSSAPGPCALSQDGVFLAATKVNDDTITVGQQWPTHGINDPTLYRPTADSSGTATDHDLPYRTLWRLCLSERRMMAGRRTWERQAPAIHAFAFSPQPNGQHERILAVAYGTMILLYNTITGRCLAGLKGNGRVVLDLKWSTLATQNAEIYDYWSNDDSPDILVLTAVTIDGAKLVHVQQPDHDTDQATFFRSYSDGLELTAFISQISRMSSSVGKARLEGPKSALRGANQPKVSKMRAISVVTDRIRKSGTGLSSRVRKDEPIRLDHQEPNAGRPQSLLRDSSERDLDVGSGPTSPATVVADEKMVSSLELPKAKADGYNSSQMPFLSPSIPSRRLPPVDEHIDLVTDAHKLFGEQSQPGSPLLYRSREASFTSIRQPDSDSDDETFVPGTMHGSASFLPGGVNVPLPKGCGAVFADNGTLVTFFERRSAVRVADASLVSSKISAYRDRTRRMAKLFPSFARIEDTDDDAEPSASDVSSDSDVESDDETQKDDLKSGADLLETISLPLDLAENAKVFSAVYDLGDILGSPRRLALSYHFSRDRDTSLAAVCERNAKVAKAAGQIQQSTILHLLAILVDDDESEDVVNKARPSFVKALPLQCASSREPGSADGIDSAESWIVRQCFQWAENRADMQFLALMSALLVQASPSKETDMIEGARTGNIANPQTSVHQSIDGRPLTPSENVNSKVSPKKETPRSVASSRQSSKPTTPYLESGANTPPLPAISSRQSSSKLSTSPGLHRSSFGAAARQYAQTITDRFATYGSSPPTKKISPASAEELAGSLKSKMGSWTKSVSFAKTESTVDGAGESVAGGERGYDSDRTIEDVAMPQTPRRGVAIPVTVNVMNAEAFGNPGGDTTDFEKGPLPIDLAQKAIVWRRHYAEQLRCWGMLIEAAEMENIGESTAYTSHGSPLLAESHLVLTVGMLRILPVCGCGCGVALRQARTTFALLAVEVNVKII
ncbi:hypothetical protein LTR78_008572 [Recurvomyces mirabilis]|uniref:Uncharacterized protein n=1 Tax=Recurvomyces mirabilis TaxID=574656 RepID=A0AAE0WHM7_9PEZI|nr:hypothetical protein LTR78_008572 [Recurvomyces mirabilis]KAK5153516.1 hypothetical protein LTS14_007687 [Recurvomyces mirabilis]